MKDYGKVKSFVKPEAKIIDEYSVWVNTDIKELNITILENPTTIYEFNQIQYTKDEYIDLLDNQVTETQLALCEVYEMML